MISVPHPSCPISSSSSSSISSNPIIITSSSIVSPSSLTLNIPQSTSTVNSVYDPAIATLPDPPLAPISPISSHPRTQISNPISSSLSHQLPSETFQPEYHNFPPVISSMSSPSFNVHPMQTRSKSGIVKSKTPFVLTVESCNLPKP